MNNLKLLNNTREVNNLSRGEIRQLILGNLSSEYSYPEDYLKKRAIFVSEDDFFGIQINNDLDKPFFIVSIGKKGDFVKAENNLRTALFSQCYASLGMSTDGTEHGTHIIKRRFDRNETDYISDIERFSSIASAKRKPLKLDKLTNKVENVFFEAHSCIRDIDGLHADEALDELSKVIFVKIYDEEQSFRQDGYRFNSRIYGTVEEYASIIRTLYDKVRSSLREEKLLNGIGVFSQEIRLSSSCIVEVAKTLESYTVSESGVDVKGRAFQKVIGRAIRAGMGQYFTPHEVIDFMVEVSKPTIDDMILDPFCGSAHFLTTCLKEVSRGGGNRLTIKKFSKNNLYGIEKSDRMVRIAMTDMRLCGDGHSNILCADSLLDFSNYDSIAPEMFDLVLTNPPFGSILTKDTINNLGTFELLEARKSVPLEILGLERSVRFLKPGGRLGIVLPDGILSNRSTTYVREWIRDKIKVLAIISLPIETFTPFGANVKTSILFGRKWKPGEIKEPNYDIFLGRIDNVGYDSTGKVTKGSELKLVAKDIVNFIEKRKW